MLRSPSSIAWMVNRQEFTDFVLKWRTVHSPSAKYTSGWLRPSLKKGLRLVTGILYCCTRTKLISFQCHSEDVWEVSWVHAPDSLASYCPRTGVGLWAYYSPKTRTRPTVANTCALFVGGDFMCSDQVLIELVTCISSNHVSNKLQKSRVLALTKCKKAEFRRTLLFSIGTLLFSFC